MAPTDTALQVQAGDAQLDGCCACACGAKGAGPPALFVDEEFPARWHVLSNGTVAAAWLRPHELCAEPRFFKEDCSRFAVKQGGLGDCWFMAGCAAIADREDLLKQVVPEGQVLFGPGYDGSVRFRLWHLGEWQEVRVDDRLPVDARGVPVYARCHHRDKFWLPLLEKAFAKFHKHFGILDFGMLSEGLINITGFSMQRLQFEHWNIWNTDENFQKIKYAYDNEGLTLCLATKPGPGIPDCHVYTVTKVYERDPKKKGEGKLQLVRVRNPWGGGLKWDGAWKDGDERWDEISKEEKEIMEYNPEDNGEFWMDMKDFTKSFAGVVMGTKTPLGAEEMEVVAQITGKWSPDKDEGGDYTELQKFAKKPQFSLIPLGFDEPESGQEEKHINTMEGMDVIVELLRGHCRRKSFNNRCIAFYVFEWSGERRLSAEQLRALERVEAATEAQDEVAVSARLRLRPGRRYVVLPATDAAGQEGDFLLRIFSRHARVRLAPLPP